MTTPEILTSTSAIPTTRVVTLTGRAPVVITEAEWPEIAVARWHDGKVRSQAIRSGWLMVRRHADGRVLVYGGYNTSMEGEHDLRGGEVLVPSGDVVVEGGMARPERISSKLIADAVYRVAITVGASVVAEECIADLPPEVI